MLIFGETVFFPIFFKIAVCTEYNITEHIGNLLHLRFLFFIPAQATSLSTLHFFSSQMSGTHPPPLQQGTLPFSCLVSTLLIVGQELERFEVPRSVGLLVSDSYIPSVECSLGEAGISSTVVRAPSVGVPAGFHQLPPLFNLLSDDVMNTSSLDLTSVR